MKLINHSMVYGSVWQLMISSWEWLTLVKVWQSSDGKCDEWIIAYDLYAVQETERYSIVSDLDRN